MLRHGAMAHASRLVPARELDSALWASCEICMSQVYNESTVSRWFVSDSLGLANRWLSGLFPRSLSTTQHVVDGRFCSTALAVASAIYTVSCPVGHGLCEGLSLTKTITTQNKRY